MHQSATIDAVIFDCDGTLVDSETLGFETILERAAALGFVAAEGEDMLALKGQSMPLLLQTIARRLGRALPPDFEVELREAMAAKFRERLQPIPRAAETLARLHVPYCVASNGPRHKTLLTLGVTGLLPLFEGRVFSAWEVGEFKPSPALFLAAAQAMGVAPERCAVVEDSEPGVRAGLAAGMKVHLLRSGQPLAADLTAQVQTLDSLWDLVGSDWNVPR